MFEKYSPLEFYIFKSLLVKKLAFFPPQVCWGASPGVLQSLTGVSPFLLPQPLESLPSPWTLTQYHCLGTKCCVIKANQAIKINAFMSSLHVREEFSPFKAAQHLAVIVFKKKKTTTKYLHRKIKDKHYPTIQYFI